MDIVDHIDGRDATGAGDLADLALAAGMAAALAAAGTRTTCAPGACWHKATCGLSHWR